MKIGVQIRNLRKEKGISQDVLAKHLGVTFQAVSKWENGSTMPDIAMLPMIARYFGVSVDYLLEYDPREQDEDIRQICTQAFSLRSQDPAQAEALLRRGLERYPNNELLINHLVYVLKDMGKWDETVLLCKLLIDTTRDDEVKYDAYGVLLETYKKQGNLSLLQEELKAIPEVYFTKLELIATLLDGTPAYDAALDQKFQSLGMAMEMALIAAKHLRTQGQTAAADTQVSIAESILHLMRSDPLPPPKPLLSIDHLAEELHETKKMPN